MTIGKLIDKFAGGFEKFPCQGAGWGDARTVRHVLDGPPTRPSSLLIRGRARKEVFGLFHPRIFQAGGTPPGFAGGARHYGKAETQFASHLANLVSARATQLSHRESEAPSGNLPVQAPTSPLNLPSQQSKQNLKSGVSRWHGLPAASAGSENVIM